MNGRSCLGVALLAIALHAGPAAGADILLATTTSVEDSGLLDELLPVFEKQTGDHLKVVAVGSGAALRMGAEGNADVLLTHAPPAEEELVAAGAVLGRIAFMENHFVVAGPPADPAKVSQASDGADALRRIAQAKAPYVSRDDDSGTHRKERALLAAAGLGEQPDWPGFTRTGTGMGITLMVAGEREAYVLSDIGTLLAYGERTGLAALTRASDDLRNVYSVLRVNPERFPGRIEAEAAERLERFLLSPETQRRIGEFGRERYGRPLFVPLRPKP